MILIYTPPQKKMTYSKWYKLIFLVMSISRSLSAISLWQWYMQGMWDVMLYEVLSHPPCDTSPDIWPISRDIWPIFRILCDVLANILCSTRIYNHRGWDLCLTGELLPRFRRSVPVTYTSCMYDTQSTPLLREGILHAHVRCGVIFTQTAVLLQLRGTMTCTGTPSTWYI